jgi:hypothetical protein
VLDGVSSVQKIDAVVLHRGTASACMRSWRKGLNPPSVRMSTFR